MPPKRKVNYPTARPSKGPLPPPTPQITPPTVARINLKATTGNQAIRVGMRVTILGNGLYAGEEAVVETLVPGVIPAATVRTAAGRTRRVRTVDLAPVPGGSHAPSQEPPADSSAG